ncbi:hypothetical protein HK097_009304 [Rhizophlyctis rosea]|uniref:Uncharacterized protein n=1 Tax=Rhizophlyctis rosea TaxID=64517 RepID=A0AAD5X4P1_9FUNG|nr:hypothetical protein HK097_009304 [Rhizophlyctis rosea]
MLTTFQSNTSPFSSKEEVDEYLRESPLRGKESRTTLFTAAQGYFQEGEFEKAEQTLMEYLKWQPGAEEATTKLGEAFKREGRLVEAIHVYSQLVEKELPKPHGKPEPLIVEVAQLQHRKAKAAAMEGQDPAIWLKQALERLNGIRSIVQSTYSRTALELMTDIYKFFREKGIKAHPNTIQLAEETAEVAETLPNAELHVQLLRFLLHAAPDRAWKYAVDKRPVFSRDLVWLKGIKERFPELKKACCGRNDNIDLRLDFLTFELTVESDIAYTLLNESENFESAVTEFMQAVDDSDALLPIESDQPAAHQWVQIRQEFVAYGQTYKGLMKLRKLRSIWRDRGDINRQVEMIHTIFQHLLVSLSYQPKTESPNLRERETHRVGLTAHILLQFLACFEPKWLLSPYRLPSGDAVARPSDVKASESFSLPSFADIHLPDVGNAKKGGEKNGYKQVKALVDSLKTSKDGLWQADERSLVDDAWDLDRVVTIAAWHLESGNLRAALRRVFKNLPEKTELRTPRMRRKPMPTVADMEAFLLILLIQRHVSCTMGNNAHTLGEVLYLSALGMWKPTAMQVAFWRKAVSMYGKDARASYYEKELLTDAKFHHAIREVRGDVRFPRSVLNDGNNAVRDQQRRTLFGMVGLEYDKMFTRTGLDCVNEAQTYLSVCKGWEEGRTDDWEGQDKTESVVFVDSDVDVRSFGFDDEKLEAAHARMTQVLAERVASLPPRIDTPKKVSGTPARLFTPKKDSPGLKFGRPSPGRKWSDRGGVSPLSSAATPGRPVKVYEERPPPGFTPSPAPPGFTPSPPKSSTPQPTEEKTKKVAFLTPRQQRQLNALQKIPYDSNAFTPSIIPRGPAPQPSIGTPGTFSFNQSIMTEATPAPTGPLSSVNNGGGAPALAPMHFTPQRAPGELDFSTPDIRELGRRGIVKSLSQKFREGTSEDVTGGGVSRKSSVEDVSGGSVEDVSGGTGGLSSSSSVGEVVGSPRYSRLAGRLKALSGENRFG